MYVNFNFNRKIKYIIYFILGFIIAMSVSNAKAVELPIMSNNEPLTEKFIYDNFKKLYSDFDINRVPYIICYSSGGNYSCIAGDERYFQMLSVGEQLYATFYRINISGGQANHFGFNGSQTSTSISKISNSGYDVELSENNSNYMTFPINTPYKSSNLVYGVYSNFELSDFISGAEKLKGTHNVLDFGFSNVKPLIKIDYLDSKYEVLKSATCSELSTKKCELEINSNEGSYIKITYYLKKLLGNNLDFLNNNTYQLRSKITGFNTDTKLAYYNYFYYFNDSTSNVDSALIYPNNVTHYVNDNLHTYLSTFVNKTDYNSVSVYEFSEFYNTNGSSYTTISVPYTFVFGNLGADLNRVEEIQINNQQTIIDQNQTTIDQNNQIKDSINDLNSNITNDNIDGASGVAGGFFNDFKDNDHGLSKIVITPLTLVNQITSKTCQVINLPLPYVNKNVTLPCMSEVYKENFGSVFSIYQMVIFGFISYYVCINVFRIVKEMKDPNMDKIEVFDL